MKPAISSPSLSLFFLRLNKPSSASLPSYVKCFSPLTILMTLCRACSGTPITFLHWATPNWTEQSHKCGLERNNHLPWSAGYILPNRLAQYEGGLLGLLMFIVQQDAGVLFCKGHPCPFTPSLPCCRGLFHPSCRTLHLPMLNGMRFLSANFSSLSRLLWRAAFQHINHFSTVWYHPQTCWECTSFHHPGC